MTYIHIYSGYYQNVRLTAVKLGKHRLRLRAVKLGSPGHIIKRFLRRKVRTANWSYGQQSYGELSVRRIARTANCPYGEESIRRTCLRRTCIRRTCLRRIARARHGIGCRAVRRKQVRRIQVRRMQFRRMDTSPYGQFAVRTIRRTDNSP